MTTSRFTPIVFGRFEMRSAGFKRLVFSLSPFIQLIGSRKKGRKDCQSAGFSRFVRYCLRSCLKLLGEVVHLRRDRAKVFAALDWRPAWPGISLLSPGNSRNSCYTRKMAAGRAESISTSAGGNILDVEYFR